MQQLFTPSERMKAKGFKLKKVLRVSTVRLCKTEKKISNVLGAWPSIFVNIIHFHVLVSYLLLLELTDVLRLNQSRNGRIQINLLFFLVCRLEGRTKKQRLMIVSFSSCCRFWPQTTKTLIDHTRLISVLISSPCAGRTSLATPPALRPLAASTATL